MKSKQLKGTKIVLLGLCLALPLMLGLWLTNSAEADVGSHRYGEVLQKSFFFYEAQQAGELPEWNRVVWRGDSVVDDGADVGIDLSGGWYDAGDHVKFGFPMAFSVTQLAWGIYEDRDAYADAGQLDIALRNIKYVTDYFIAAHPEPNVLYGQVGNGGVDHAYWGPSETMNVDRPVYRIDASCPGSDLAGETAAAMAASSIIFAREGDTAYSAELLSHAVDLFNFADTYRGTYPDCITDAQGYYNSFSGYEDELTWAAIWLHLATGEQSYLDYADASTANWNRADYGNSPYWEWEWSYAWDDKHYAAQVLLYELTGKQAYKDSAERNLDFWTIGVDGNQVSYTPGGLARLDQWGPNRYAMNTSWIALVYADLIADSEPAKAQRYIDFAESQVDYVLGNNPLNLSYVIGYGDTYVQNPHHRAAHNSYLGLINDPVETRHVLYGALVGGPDGSDDFPDSREDYVTSEVATDYNAAFTSVMAKMYAKYGGDPDPNFPPPPPEEPLEFFVGSKANLTGQNGMTLTATMTNISGWPARGSEALSTRYFADMSEVIASGYQPSDVEVTLNSSEAVTVSAWQQWAGDIYFIDIGYAGINIYPGSIQHYFKRTSFNFSSPGVFDPQNDWSFQGMADEDTPNPYMPVYENGVKVYGLEPDDTPPTSTPLPTATNTPDPNVDTPTPSATGACEVAYELANQWDNGYQANVTISNTGTAPIAGWTLTFDHAPGQTVDSAWNATVTQSGSAVTASNPASHWNGTIQPGGSASFGMQVVKGSGSAVVPTVFAVNGDVCGGVVAPTATAVPATATSVPATATVAPPTATSVPPTATSVPATATAVPPTATSVPATATSVPPTATSIPATATVVPVTATVAPATATPVAPTATPSTGSSCAVDYDIVNQWGNGFQANVTISNSGSSAVAGYTLSWDFANGETVNSGWNATFSQSGTTASASNTAGHWNGTIQPGSSVSFGFTGDHSGTVSVPSAFSLNGALCD